MLVLPTKSAAVWEKFITENKVLVYKYIVREIKKGLDTGESRIELFKFEDDSKYAWIPRHKILVTLQEAMTLFLKHEEYEYARKTDNIIRQYHVETLIHESNVEE